MTPADDLPDFTLGRSVDVRIGRELSAFRDGAGLTTRAAAEALSIPETTILAFELGTVRVPAGLLIALGKLYGFTQLELFTRVA